MKYLNDLLKQQIYDQYMDQDLRLSYKDLANKYKICEKTVYNIIKQFGGTKTQCTNNPSNKQNQQPKSKPKPISETTNKFISSELTKYVSEPTPQRRGSKNSSLISDFAAKMRQEAADKRLVSECHYDDVEPRRGSKEPLRRGSKEPQRRGSKIVTEQLPLFDLEKIFDKETGNFIK